MKLDLALLALIVLFAFFGSLSGAAKQIAHVMALATAYWLGRPLGELAAPTLGKGFGLSPTVAQGFSTLAGVIFVLLVTRVLLTLLLRRVISGQDREDRTADRALGFLLGGTKIAALSYLVLSALTFVEQNVSVGDRRLQLAPRDSVAAAFVRRHNLFQLTRFSAAVELARLAQLMRDPRASARMSQNPALQALGKDSRLKRVLNEPDLQRAIAEGDTQTLIGHPKVRELLRDPKFLERVKAASEALTQ